MATATMPDANRATRPSRWPYRLALVVGILFIFSLVLFIFSRLSPTNAPAAPVPELQAVAPGALADESDTLLAWVGNGAGPGQQPASSPGTLAFMDGTGATTPIMELPNGTNRIQLCGDQATSPDGTMIATFIGQDVGNLYLMRGTDEPVTVASVQALTCLGNGTFQFSPDSSRLAYISYEPGAAQSEFADGFIHVLNSADLQESFSEENVVAFDITNEGVAYVSFIPNSKGEADDVAINWWSGSASIEAATLQPTGEKCRFTSAQIAVLPDGKFLAVLGHRCTTGDTHTEWQLYSVDPSERSANMIAHEFQAGAFAAFARTNSIYVSPDGAHAYFTFSDGITANTVGMNHISVGDMSLSNLIDRQIVMPTYSGAANAFPQTSPDGQWLAMVLTSPNNQNTLHIINLSNPDVPPIDLSAGSAGDIISGMVFTPDSSRLLVVAGGAAPVNNSLFAIDLATGNDFRVSRGRFGRTLAISPNGESVALIDWKIVEDPKEPAYATTVIIQVDNSEVATLYTGADIVDGKVTKQTFIEPLVWPGGSTEPSAS